MKSFAKKAAALLCAALLLAALAGTALASSKVTAQLRPDMTILIDGTARTFYAANGQQVHPILCNGTTYLPVRAIGELMGKLVDWNQSTKTVTLSGARTGAPTGGTPDKDAAVKDVTVELRQDFTVVVDGVKQSFTDAGGNAVYPLLSSGSTYLPVRAIGELMGASVDWDGRTKTVTLETTLVTDADTFSGEDGKPAGNGTSVGGGTSAGSGLISAEDARSKALAHAGLTEKEVTFVKTELEREDGRRVYDIEFYTADGQEYDYEIDAASGEIRGFDYDAEGYTPPAAAGQSITREQAREIALAKVPGADASHVKKLKLDRDGGRSVYEVEIVYSGMEYEMEIDAASGTVLEFESDSVHD